MRNGRRNPPLNEARSALAIRVGLGSPIGVSIPGLISGFSPRLLNGVSGPFLTYAQYGRVTGCRLSVASRQKTPRLDDSLPAVASGLALTYSAHQPPTDNGGNNYG